MHQQSIDTTCHLLAVAVEWWRFQERSLHQSPFVLINTSGHTALHLSCECFPSLNVSSFLYLFLCHQPMDTSFFFVFLVRMLAQREPESDYVQLCSRPWWTQVRHSVVDWVQAICSITLQLAGAYSFLPCPLSAFHYKEALHKWLKAKQQLLIPHTAMTCVKLQLDWFGNPNQWNYLIGAALYCAEWPQQFKCCQLFPAAFWPTKACTCILNNWWHGRKSDMLRLLKGTKNIL